MSSIYLQSLILTAIGIDIVIIVLFIFLIRKLRVRDNGGSLDKEIKMFESLITDAGKMATQFEEQLTEKHRVIKKLNEQLDTRITKLNLSFNRADLLLSSHGKGNVEADDKGVSLKKKEEEIAMLAGKGHKIEEIATKLSIPKEEVSLVLDLKRRFSQADAGEGVS
jgi:hypothetical protein